MTTQLLVYAIYYSLLIAALVLFVLGGDRRANRRLLWGCGGIMVLGLLALLARTSEPNHLMDDFLKAYYPAGRLILQDPSRLYAGVREEAQAGNLLFVNVPMVALLFAPISMLPEKIAEVVFSALGIAAILAACHMLKKLADVAGWRALALYTLVLTNGPLWYSFKEGNLTHFVLALLVGTLYFSTKRCEGLAGACLAVAGLIKLPLFLLVVCFLLRRRWRALAGFSTMLLAATGLSLALFGIELHLQWWRECIDPFAGRPFTAFNAQSLNAFLARCLTNGSLVHWLPVEVDWQFKFISKAIVCCLIAVTARVLWRAPASSTSGTMFCEFSIFICLALVISPVSWTHYYLFLLIPAALCLGEQLTIRRSWPSSIGMLAGVALASPPVLLITVGLPDWTRFMVSNYFYGCLVLLGVFWRLRWNMRNGRKRSARLTAKPRRGGRSSDLAHTGRAPGIAVALTRRLIGGERR